jgi:hypothetical protein
MILAGLVTLAAALMVLMVARERKGTPAPSFRSMVRHQRRHFNTGRSVTKGVM